MLILTFLNFVLLIYMFSLKKHLKGERAQEKLEKNTTSIFWHFKIVLNIFLIFLLLSPAALVFLLSYYSVFNIIIPFVLLGFIIYYHTELNNLGKLSTN